MADAIATGMEIVMDGVETVFTTVTTIPTSGTGIGNFFYIGIAVSLCLVGVNLIKRLCWGA